MKLSKKYEKLKQEMLKEIGNFSLFFKGETGKFKNSGSNESVESILSVQNM